MQTATAHHLLPFVEDGPAPEDVIKDGPAPEVAIEDGPSRLPEDADEDGPPHPRWRSRGRAWPGCHTAIVCKEQSICRFFSQGMGMFTFAAFDFCPHCKLFCSMKWFRDIANFFVCGVIIKSAFSPMLDFAIPLPLIRLQWHICYTYDLLQIWIFSEQHL